MSGNVIKNLKMHIQIEIKYIKIMSTVLQVKNIFNSVYKVILYQSLHSRLYICSLYLIFKEGF